MNRLMNLILVAAVLSPNLSLAASAQVAFGESSARGQLQKIEIFTQKVPISYFTEEEQWALKSDAESQLKNQIWPDQDPDMRS